ncbi:hypothetical protein Tsubulata_018642 [Turnera subulata]|uniref:Uncharacterized protein n=1 Tax=Turnera subulata TaxID=218843 RepID=A0A9Q0GDQ4_9ROSI|nr:hypothetical protein Tsubulata_018642 [Turnera subulata]
MNLQEFCPTLQCQVMQIVDLQRPLMREDHPMVAPVQPPLAPMMRLMKRKLSSFMHSMLNTMTISIYVSYVTC